MRERQRILTYSLLGFFLLHGLSLAAQPESRFKAFGKVKVAPDFVVDGAGRDVDTIAFWETPDSGNTLMFVTAKGNQLVEVWKYPFINGEQTPIKHSSFGSGTRVNGVVMDQESDLLYVSVSAPVSTVSVFSFPGGNFVRQFIAGDKNLKSEPNIDLYHFKDGTKHAYVTADNIVHIYDAETGNYINDFKPSTSVETVVADEFHEIIYLPDEKSGKGIFAFNPEGSVYKREGKQSFGSPGIFDSDAEGILIYTFPMNGNGDDGSGLIVVSDQKKNATDFEFFDRQTWEYLGTLQIEGVSNTDGIASTQKPLPDYPQGLFVAIDNDAAVAGVGWQVVFEATGLLDGFVSGSVTGSVIHDDTGEPIAGANVELRQSGETRYQTSSVDDGTYTLSNVAGGDYQLVCSKSGFETASLQAQIVDGQTQTVPDFNMVPIVDVTPPAPPSNVQVTLESGDNSPL